jgi:MFS family permease
MLTRTVGLFALSMFALLVLGIIAGALTQKEPTPQLTDKAKVLFPMPALVLEFARRGSDLKEIVTNVDEKDVREKLQAALVFDCFFIVMYLLLFVGIALVLGQRGGVWVWVAVAAAVCAIGAATADGAENLAMARAVEQRSAAAIAAGQSGQASAAILASPSADIATPGFFKWAFIFASLALLSFTFVGRDWGLSTALFALSALIAALGAAGLLVLKAQPEEFRPVQLAFTLMMLLVLLVGVALTWRPEKF